MKIALTGTPGTGKTSVSKLLAKKLGYKILELNKEIRKNKLYSGYDKKRKTYIADMNKINRFLNRKTNTENWIIDSHLSHFFKNDFVIVLRCEPNEIKRRLKGKRWDKEKIRENFEAELIGVISYEARQRNKKVCDIDTTNKSINSVVKDVLKALKENKSKTIDWIK